MTRLLTVVLNWRTPGMTLRAVEAALVAMEGIEGEITVVDNASGDGSADIIHEAIAARGWSRVRLVESPVNGGFGSGNNVGIRAGLSDGSRPDLVYVLNSDAFPEPGAIRALIDHLDRHPEAGFAGSFIFGQNGETHVTAFRFPTVASEFEAAARTGPISRLLRRSQVWLPVPSVSGPVDWSAGASMMMRQEVLDRIGLFDETFFLYFEETDLCRRARAAGWQVHYVVESRVMHIGSVSTGMKQWTRVPGYWFDSRWHYYAKGHGRAYAAAATLAHAAGGMIHRLRRALAGQRAEDPPQFLTTLLIHDAKALFRRPSARSNQETPHALTERRSLR